MKKYFSDAQNLVNQWTTYLKLPHLFVKLYSGPTTSKNKKGAISVESATIIIWTKNIPNKAKFILVLLHELSHWWFYWKYRDKVYKDEKHVIKKSYSLLKKFYPEYYKKLKVKTCQ